MKSWFWVQAVWDLISKRLSMLTEDIDKRVEPLRVHCRPDHFLAVELHADPDFAQILCKLQLELNVGHCRHSPLGPRP